jgi:hypothetical protein
MEEFRDRRVSRRAAEVSSVMLGYVAIARFSAELGYTEDAMREVPLHRRAL